MYNEDGSEMFNLAAEFKETFKVILKEAKSVVEGPAAPKQTLKLKVGADPGKIKIKFGAKASPGPARIATPAGDRDTPESAKPSTNGAPRPAVNGKPALSATGASNTPAPTLNTAQEQSSRSASINGVKNESTVQSPALGTVRPLPANKPAVPPTSYQLPTVDGPPPSLVESIWRAKGQPKEDYILPELRLSNHPSVPDPKFRFKIPASDTSLHQSVTFTVPASHNTVRLSPHIPVGVTTRPYRLFVSVNGTRASEVVAASAGYQNGLLNHHPQHPMASMPGLYGLEKERDKTRPVFDAKLERGAVNKIEVEVLAGKAPSALAQSIVSSPDEKDREIEKEKKKGKDVQWEKITLFVHVMRH
jgi:hypothetical protein